jgi:integrase
VLGKLKKVNNSTVFATTASAFKQAFKRTIQRAKKLYLIDCNESDISPDPTFMHGLRFHDLRHESTSRLFELGLNVMEVASITGHKELKMLARYTHLKAENLAKKLN